MECVNLMKNKQICTCTYTLTGTSELCPRKGLCCECIAYHREAGQMPGCLFPPDSEKSYDRSIRKFVEGYK